MKSLTPQEIFQNQHSCHPNPAAYKVIRYEVDVDPEKQAIAEIVIVFRSDKGDFRRLRFTNPRLSDHGPFRIPSGLEGETLFVVDTTARGWEKHQRIEVGSLAEDMPTYFWAESVQLDSDPRGNP